MPPASPPRGWNGKRASLSVIWCCDMSLLRYSPSKLKQELQATRTGSRNSQRPMSLSCMASCRIKLTGSSLRLNLQEMPHLTPTRTPESFTSWLPATSRHLTWTWPHLVYIQRHLTAVTTGACKRLLIICPPRHGKTEQATIHYPAYRLECDPSLRIAI